MDETLAILAGLVLGLFFYAGLWWTIRNLADLRRPGAGFVASLLLRMVVTLGGFWFVADGAWQKLLLCLLGFVIGRVAVTWSTRVRPTSMEHRHAP